jgi:hypothetical protein
MMKSITEIAAPLLPPAEQFSPAFSEPILL